MTPVMEAGQQRAIAMALGAAALFGVSTPAAKVLLAASHPWLLAGLLYLGSGLALALVAFGVPRSARPVLGGQEAPLGRRELPSVVAAIIAGGVVGPVLLMFGLAAGSASTASLVLNLEGAFTALLAWSVLREHVSARIAVGMLTILAGALVLAWDPRHPLAFDRSAVLVAGACLAWAVDNNVTRRLSGHDPVQLAAVKGLAAGAANVIIAMWAGAGVPSARVVVSAALLGVVSYGVSLVLFILALRDLGSSRTAAYFSTAPFLGAVTGVVVLQESASARLAAAGALMAVGVWLHLTERHDHQHQHEPLEHEHLHRHDEHHRHAHTPETPVVEPHSHWHAHGGLHHRHPHFPDLHHRHLH